MAILPLGPHSWESPTQAPGFSSVSVQSRGKVEIIIFLKKKGQGRRGAKREMCHN